PPAGLVADGRAYSELVTRHLIDGALRLVADFHRQNPLRPGIPKASLASRLGATPAAVEALVEKEASLEDRGTVVASAAFSVGRTPQQEEVWDRARRSLREAGWAVPRLSELPLEPELAHALARGGELVRVSEDFAYLPEQIHELTERARSLDDGFTVSEFKDSVGLSRKYAVPLLEWMDANGVTVRTRDRRRARR
ncbi:MAG: SelB C-terminal domain-containing protein, partial [Acidimicrobiia bacterium]